MQSDVVPIEAAHWIAKVLVKSGRRDEEDCTTPKHNLATFSGENPERNRLLVAFCPLNACSDKFD